MATLPRLSETELDRSIADKRIFRVVDRHGEEVGRIFSDTVPVAPAEACTEVGAEPAGQHRTSPLIVAWLMVRRWLF